jgi:hypothetical protein
VRIKAANGALRRRAIASSRRMSFPKFCRNSSTVEMTTRTPGARPGGTRTGRIQERRWTKTLASTPSGADFWE